MPEDPAARGPMAVLEGGARSARREGSPYPKAALLPRSVARLTDLIISLALSSVAGPVGILAGFLYLLIADALLSGQSIGKRLGGIRAVHVPTRTPAGLGQSMIRNSPFALAFVFYAVPIVGWFLLVIVGLPLLGFETYMVYSDSLGIRIGDVFADTQVVDAKVVAGRPVSISPVVRRESA